MVGVRGWGRREQKVFNGDKVSIGEDEKILGRRAVMLHNDVNAFNATELYTSI